MYLACVRLAGILRLGAQTCAIGSVRVAPAAVAPRRSCVADIAGVGVVASTQCACGMGAGTTVALCPSKDALCL
jgi:hypothetical protein